MSIGAPELLDFACPLSYCRVTLCCEVTLEKKLFALCLSELIKHIGGRKGSG